MRNGEPRFDCPNRDELERDSGWWEIYRNSFPPDEQEAQLVILEATASGAGLALRAQREERTVAIATTHLLENPPAAFLVYLAVHKEHRSTGLGGALFEYAWSASLDKLRERGLDAIGMVWEVDSPAVANDPIEAAARDRRIAFFRRHGGTLLPQPYIQPPLEAGRAVPMQLMFRAANKHSLPDSAVTQALMSAMYFEKYGAANGIPHETLTALLSRNTIPRNIEHVG